MCDPVFYVMSAMMQQKQSMKAAKEAKASALAGRKRKDAVALSAEGAGKKARVQAPARKTGRTMLRVSSPSSYA